MAKGGKKLNKLKIFSCTAGRELAFEICENLDVEHSNAEIVTFSNDNKFIKICESVRECDVYVIQGPSPPVDSNIMELLIMIDALRRASAKRITVVLPYFPYSRSDKKDQPRVPITARLISDLLHTAGAYRVITMDLTADQIQGFFVNILDHLTALPIIVDALRNHVDLENSIIVAPDAGGVKRAQKLAEILSLELGGVLVKNRKNLDGEVSISAILNNVSGKDIIIIDDEIDTANSLKSAAELLIDHGANNITAVCTHAVFSKNAINNIESDAIKQIITTNTFPVPSHPKIIVKTVAPLFANAIRCNHTGNSISSLFT